jgi:hypothetical protein
MFCKLKTLGSGLCTSVEREIELTRITVMIGDCRGLAQWNFDEKKNKIRSDVHIIIPKYHFMKKMIPDHVSRTV